MKERRVHKRIPVEKLPDYLNDITFKLDQNTEFTAEIINASKSGLLLQTKGLSVMDVYPGAEITIIISSYDHDLKAEIIHVRREDNNIVFGVSFHHDNPIQKYHELLAKALNYGNTEHRDVPK